jgi:glycosyltransferase involved in cell wall biosynthesis
VGARVSVAIPCHNYGQFLAESVNSVTSQAGVDVDVMIIDDCSDDDSVAVAQALARADPRVRLVVHDRNAGHIATYNEGLAAAVGEYFVLLSADDYLAPGSFARATALLDTHPSVGFAYGNAVRFRSAPERKAIEEVSGWTIWNGLDWIANRCRTGTNRVSSPTVVMRTSVQQAIGDYRAELPHSGDMEMWLRAAAVADVGIVEGADQAFYRRHDDSLRSVLCVGPTDDLRARHDAFASVLGPSSTVPGAEALYRQACRGLARSALMSALGSNGRPEVADEFEAFALELWPDLRRSPQWLAFQLRRSGIGRWAARVPAFRRVYQAVRAPSR